MLELAVIFGSIVGGSVVVTGMTLAFVSQLDKRERAEDAAEAPYLHPFQRSLINKCACVACGAISTEDVRGDHIAGPFAPACCTSETCAANGVPHLHVSCETCKSTWLMATATAKKK